MKILLASPIHADAFAWLRERHEIVEAYDAPQDVLKAVIPGCHILIFRSGVMITREIMAQAPMLNLIIRAGSGIDNIDLDYVIENNIRLVRIPGPGAKAVAEMAFTLMLNLARNIRTADELLRQGHWAKHQMTGYLLTGKVLGIVGTGNIGTRVGQLGAAWGMKVIGCEETYKRERAEQLSQLGIQTTTFAEVISTSDFVCLHVPKTPATTHMINAETIACMKQGAYLVNLARGGVVDEQALYQALISGHLGGAALDVHEKEGEGKISPLAALPNVILTPHIGAGTFDSQREIGEIAVAKIREFEEEMSVSPLSGRVLARAIEVIG
jgi:D-3-phosphoglycerate dehydrogenase / 2-oxoglutarate reductase